MLALAVMMLVVAAVVHMSADFDSCLLYGTSHRGSNHSSHVCQICNVGSWAVGPNSPAAAPLHAAMQVDQPDPGQRRTVDREEVSAPRAPPFLLA